VRIGGVRDETVLVRGWIRSGGCSYASSKSVGHVADVRGWLKSRLEAWRTSARLLPHNDPQMEEPAVQSKRLQRWCIRAPAGRHPDIISTIMREVMRVALQHNVFHIVTGRTLLQLARSRR
jgi:hypothetical protein